MTSPISFFTSDFRNVGYQSSLSKSFEGQLASGYSNALHDALMTDQAADWIGFLYYQQTGNLTQALAVVAAVTAGAFTLDDLFGAAQGKTGPVAGSAITDPTPTLTLTKGALAGIHINLTPMLGGLDTEYFTTGAGKNGTTYHTREFFTNTHEPANYNPDWDVVNHAPDAGQPISVSVAENLGDAATIATVIATDSDSSAPYNVLSYSITNGNAGGLFEIDSTGHISLAAGKQLDYETAQQHVLTITVTDGGGLSDTVQVTIGVTNVDEVAPVITSVASANVNENSGAGQVVYTVSATDNPDGGHPSDGPSLPLTYTLGTTHDEAAFTINGTSGAVTLTGNPDYEGKASYQIEVIATDAAGNHTTKLVTVGVNNLDEVAPVITSGATGTSVTENGPAGQVVYTATATDLPDAGHPIDGPSALTFSLSGADAAAFAIDADSGVVTFQGGADYETQPSYSFTVIATDAAGNTDSQAVTVGVNNLDEVDPVITSGATGTSVTENAAPGALVYSATATDAPDLAHPDDGPSAITYSLGGTDAALFTIDPDTGAVTLNGSADYEDQPSYSFTVIATDAAGNTDSQAVTVGVNNLDEVDPVITSGATGTSVTENAAPGALVYSATATDAPDLAHPDDGPSAITYSLGGTDAALFTIDPDTGAVTLNGSADYEDQPSYSFTVIATDAAGNTDSQAVTVGVNNLDEVDPVITSGATGTSVTENAAPGALVYSATATDAPDLAHPDDGPSAITYSLGGTDAALFTIDPDTGAVTLNGSADYEDQPSYSFTVIATDAAGNTDSQAVTVGVNNLDEVDPVITSGATGTSVTENAAPGALVYSATATDAPDLAHPDDGPSAITYSLGGTDAALFTIDPDTGAVTLNGSADYEDQPSYSFTVIATDAAGNTDSQAVTVGVNNLDEVDPVITSGATGTSVTENAAPGALVYSATATDAPDLAHPDDGPSAITYSLGGTDAALFTIDPDTGAVTLNGSADYEDQPSYSFTVIATDAAGNTDSQAVTVGVNNLDEVDPVITSGATGTSVTENAAPGALVYSATATDAPDLAHPDDGPSAITYSLGGTDAALFTIDPDTGAVTLNGSADYEDQPSYSFTVIATDAAGNTDSQAVTVGVNNLDEVDPVITSGATGTSVTENAAPGALVYSATATDAPDLAHPDDGPSAITYSLGGTDAALFTIDPDTGAVTLNGSADYEDQPSYSFTVIATDAAGNTDSQAVTVGVNNLDEVDPVITSGATGTSVTENAAPGALVYSATATDAPDLAHPDDGPSAITYSLGGTDAALFTIDPDTGAVTLNGSADYEDQPSYSFTVIATDAAGNTDSQAVTVGVNNLDEVDPVITSGATGTSVTENAAPGALVYSATATDAPDLAHPDDGPSAITYSLGGTDAALFTIDPDTGAVTLNGSADYEDQPSYSFTVIATDAAGNTDSQAVTVGVNNLDEVDPVITSGATGTSVTENAAPGALVYSATATDAPDLAHPDDGPSAITYSLGGTDAALFTIDPDTGAVTLNGSADYEDQPSYSFTVIATDAAGNTDSQAVTVGVNNLDEVDPVITSGATGTSVTENAAPGALVYSATATDAPDLAHPDDGPSAITYSLGGTDAALFTIDPDTGAVTLNGSADYEDQPSYSFTVIATDAAGNTDSQAVTVGVNNLDEVDPVITSGATGTSVTENAAPGALVYSATATDAPDLAHPDDGPSAITYSLGGTDAALFTIDPDTGAVTLNGSADYEDQPSYSFTVIATDAAGNTDSQAVTVGVNNLDEVDPVITSGATGTSVTENAAPGALVYSATATDAPDLAHPDDGPSAITYSLGGTDAALFTIDPDTGAVTLNGSADYEDQPSYSFTVIATDAAGNTDSQAVTVGVNNLDEVDPVITSGATGTSVTENAAPGALVYSATATDAPDLAHPDDGPSAITYSLGGTDAALFTIDPDTGAVTLNGSADYEDQPSYSFTVIATDAAGNTDSQAVTVGVNNLDEVDPVITSGATGTSVTENAAPGALVYSATATDAPDLAHPDDGPSAITYSLGGTDAALFTIDPDTGAVTLNGSADYEDQPSYSFTVIATDAAGNTDSQAVTVGVNNLDEVDPVITSGATGTSVTENAAPGALVYSATATDAPDLAHPDDGPSAITYSLGGTDAALFTIDPDTGAVTLNGSADYEDQPSYSFTVIATDAAGNTDSQAVTVGVNNLDEVDPVITSGATGTSVTENAAPGALVYSATATDAPDLAHPDDGPSAITYSLGGTDAALFTIDPDTGAVTLNGSADYEDQPSYSFTVIATDAAGNTDSQAVTVGVNNLDEVDPVITSGATGTSVTENAAPGALVYSATATDAPDLAHPDDGPSAITYSLGGTDAALFTIDPDTGAVTLNGSADYEDQPSYSFTVIATDAAGNTDSQAVTVGVNNLDEVDPVITSGATGTSVTENAAPGALVYSATATDAPDLAHPDDGPSAITYSLGGTDAALFTIDPDTGAVTLNGSADYEDQPSYSFTVIATDAAGNTDSQAVTVGVNNLDEVDPVITSGATGTSVTENAAPGALVYSATATDAPDLAHPDDGPSAITYSLGGTDAALFTIDPDTGAVTLNGSADYEDQPSYSFTVIATDAAGNTDSQAVTVGVNNLDEVAPSFTSGATATAINENSGAAQVIYTATATDSAADGGPSNPVTYSLGTGGDEGAFTIDASTGAVTLTGNPNYEGKASYSFTVVATDHAGNSASQTVTLAINNLDEVAPSITSSATATSIVENTAAGQVIYTATATDNPDGSHPSDGPSAITYSLGTTHDEVAFSINGSTGAVTLTGSPNFEAKASYQFEVIATDAAGNATTKLVTLGVTNRDEVNPVITSSATATAINENSGAGQTVYTVTGTDAPDGGHPSDGPSTPLTYSLAAGLDAAAFTINPGSGAVTLTGNPDYESKASYSFTVVATDTAGNQTSKLVTLAINNVTEAPTGVNDTASATEAGGLNNGTAGSNPSGNVLTNDTDPDDAQNTLFVSALRTGTEAGTGTAGTVGIALAGAYGSLTLAADGTYSYVVNQSNAAVQALNIGGTLTDTFTYTVQDPTGGTDTAQLTVTINGADDSPTGFNFVLAPTVDNGNNLDAGTLIGTFVPIGDPDGGSTTFDDPSGTNGNRFIIDHTTGALTVGATALTTGNYDVTITGHQGANTFTQTVKVWVDGATGNAITSTNNDIDLMFGLNGNDTLTGGNSSDGLVGGQGNDILFGGAGDDQMKASGGNDTFKLSAASVNGLDTIFDLRESAADRIALQQGGDGWNAAGTTPTAGNFSALAAADYVETRNAITNIALADTNKVVELQTAQTTAQITTGVGGAANAYVLVFNSDTGKGELWYDSNWSNTGGRVQVASFSDITQIADLTGLSASKIAEWA